MITLNKEQVLLWLNDVKDPEVPVLSILDLGIVRDVIINQIEGNTEVIVKITPTYSGCPAMDTIAIGIRMALVGHGINKISVEHQLSPAWTTDWMSEEAKQKLRAYGIAPPYRKALDPTALFDDDSISCPHCGSENTILVSQFGPTSCKALYKCDSCKEPFEYFKCH